MAQKVQVVLTCDLDEDEVPAADTVSFGVEGATYAFELCERHLEEFNETMQTYIGAARHADGPRRRRSTPAASTRGRQSNVASTPGNIRTWARDNGYEVSDRGRIPADVRAAFETSN
jgi:Lsr2